MIITIIKLAKVSLPCLSSKPMLVSMFYSLLMQVIVYSVCVMIYLVSPADKIALSVR